MLRQLDNSKKIDIKWTSHLKSPEEQQKFREYVLSSVGVLDRLKRILTDRVESKQVFKEEDYEASSWAYRAADRNGYLRAINEVLNIIDVNIIERTK